MLSKKIGILLFCTIIIAFINSVSLCAKGKSYNVQNNKPEDFVKLSNVVPDIQQDIRYYTNHNFVGKRINGYEAPICEVTLKTAKALKSVENKLLPWGLTLKVYDCYRPQRAVDQFLSWPLDKNDTVMQKEFYPHINKARLFKEGYIDAHSGHSRGSTVDITIVPLNSNIPHYYSNQSLKNCTLPLAQRFSDNSLDFGTGFDCFSPKAHPGYKELPAGIKANRLLLKTLMDDAGFKPLYNEWWHFTLKEEPYPDTYFNFLIN